MPGGCPHVVTTVATNLGLPYDKYSDYHIAEMSQLVMIIRLLRLT